VLQPKRLLTTPVKAEIADAITTIHTNATGAPESFVNVLFLDLPDGD
jgi:phenylpyruvate tautomerase PptA (4-oxalocrotonate tautomerase family)